MSNLLLLSPIDLLAGQISASSAAAAFPAGNLVSPKPRKIWRAAAAGAVTLTIDLGADTSIDTVFIGFLNTDSDDVWSIDAATAAAPTGWISMRAAGPVTPGGLWRGRKHALHVNAAPVTRRYVRISLNTTAAAQAGVILIGKAFRTAWNFEYGNGWKVLDQSRVEAMTDGGLSVSRRARVPIWRCTLGDLTDAEALAFLDFLEDRGESGPLLAVEDPDGAGLHGQIHYGLLSDLSWFERVDADKSRADLTIREWR